MKTTELYRLINLGLKTIGDVGKYIQLMKKMKNERNVLVEIKYSF